ncbi:hypothetical protein DZF79_28550 [Vibrio parahaemolyticus]|nr:hypothetical protein [Vibrio parahaemolyticus]
MSTDLKPIFFTEQPFYQPFVAHGNVWVRSEYDSAGGMWNRNAVNFISDPIDAIVVPIVSTDENLGEIIGERATPMRTREALLERMTVEHQAMMNAAELYSYATNNIIDPFIAKAYDLEVEKTKNVSQSDLDAMLSELNEHIDKLANEDKTPIHQGCIDALLLMLKDRFELVKGKTVFMFEKDMSNEIFYDTLVKALADELSKSKDPKYRNLTPENRQYLR